MKEELQRIFKTKLLIVTLVAVTVLPLIYGALYLWAFWDPYGKIDNIPVAIVNEDKGDKDKNFGNDLVANLKDNPAMKWSFVDRQTAEAGLVSRRYYTEAIIESDFSKNIMSVDGDNPQKAEILFKSRQASSFMATKFSQTTFDKIKSSLNEKIAKEYIDNIFSETRDSAADWQKAVDGTTSLSDGLTDAQKGGKDLYDGAESLNDGMKKMSGGLNDLYDGSIQLDEGFNKIQTGKTVSFADGVDQALIGSQSLSQALSQVNNGAVTLKSGLSTAVTSSSQLVAGSKNVGVGLSGLNSGMDQSVAGINGAKALLAAYMVATPEASSSAELGQLSAVLDSLLGGTMQTKNGVVSLQAGSDQLSAGLGQLNNGLNSLQSGSGQLADGLSLAKNGASDLSNGLKDIKEGKNKLDDGVLKLRQGLETAKNSSGELVDGTEKLKNGQNDLLDGLLKAKDGVGTLKTKLAEAVTKTLAQTDPTKTENKVIVMASPVAIDDISVDIVYNNGTGFAPYFIPLALWVGAMAVFFLIELEFKKKNLGRQLGSKTIMCLAVGAVQAMVLDIVLMKALHLQVNHQCQLFAFTILLSWCYILIQMWLNLVLGIAGKFVAIIILMLQLTSSAGTYPIETIPAFFQKINPLLPMTYAVTALKEIVSGTEMKLVATCSGVIGIMIVVMLILTGGWLVITLKKNEKNNR